MDSADLAEVQKLVKENPVLTRFFLHRLGNLLGPAINYVELIEKPDATEAQKQKYIANIKLCHDRTFEFLRECGIEQGWRK